MGSEEAVEPKILFDAAWAALLTSRPRELRHLQQLLDRPVGTGRMDAADLSRLQLLLTATARNLRMLRGQFRLQSF